MEKIFRMKRDFLCSLFVFMDFNEDLVAKLARMSKLSLSPERCKELASQLGNILEYVTLLEKVNVDGIEPTAQVTGLTQVTIPDDVSLAAYPPLQDELVKSSQQKVEAKQIKVPKVL